MSSHLHRQRLAMSLAEHCGATLAKVTDVVTRQEGEPELPAPVVESASANAIDTATIIAVPKRASVPRRALPRI